MNIKAAHNQITNAPLIYGVGIVLCFGRARKAIRLTVETEPRALLRSRVNILQLAYHSIFILAALLVPTALKYLGVDLPYF